MLTEDGWHIAELDSVPGGIGLTAGLEQTYGNHANVIGGPNGMIDGFTKICGDARNVHLMVSEESATYRPEMGWLAEQIGSHFSVRDTDCIGIKEGDSLYRFFELFGRSMVTEDSLDPHHHTRWSLKTCWTLTKLSESFRPNIKVGKRCKRLKSL